MYPGKSFSRQDNSSDAPSYSESLLKYFKRLKARVKKDRADHPGADKEVFDGAEHAAGAGAGGPSYEVCVRLLREVVAIYL